MGDAGPETPPLEGRNPIQPILNSSDGDQKVVTVLVTGFGPFKSFATNPSYLIAKSLPEYLYPEPKSFAVDAPAQFAGLAQTRPLTTPAPIIRLIVHPEQIRVAYATVARVAPELIAKHDPDYIMHIGMAGGRDFYTLETLARRDGYKIKDVDDQDGLAVGELKWRALDLPETIWTGWEENDVLARWRGDVARTCPGDEKAVVRLSRDAGKFLCEFILYNSLAQRTMEAPIGDMSMQRRNGKAAFLHVPGGIDEVAIARGRNIAEAAIRALVGSWEEGFRRQAVSGKQARVFTV
jgi:pyrrolidone-carboxylate peptidase